MVLFPGRGGPPRLETENVGERDAVSRHRRVGHDEANLAAFMGR
jgi:hypothetical protein